MRSKLQYLSRGTAVVELQTRLNALMPETRPPLQPDGIFGDQTFARVKHFQKTRGLVVDGVVGAKTWAAIDGTAPAVAGGQEPSPLPRHPANPELSYHGKGVKVSTGAHIKCSYGTNPSCLIVPTAGAATVGDCVGFVNIPPFGRCRSRDHPGYAEEEYENEDLGIEFHYQSHKPGFKPGCTPYINTPWSAPSPVYGQVDTAQVIDKTANCWCKYGGHIRFL